MDNRTRVKGISSRTAARCCLLRSGAASPPPFSGGGLTPLICVCQDLSCSDTFHLACLCGGGNALSLSAVCVPPKGGRRGGNSSSLSPLLLQVFVILSPLPCAATLLVFFRGHSVQSRRLKGKGRGERLILLLSLGLETFTSPPTPSTSRPRQSTVM